MLGGELKLIQFKDVSGKKFNKLTALHRLHNTKGKTKWLCVCDCGNFAEVILSDLQLNKTKSCGCLKYESNKTNHGKIQKPLYKTWQNMKQRCYNSNNKSYNNYGGRGIAVCSEWLNDFQAFYNWSVVNGYKNGLQIDRIDVNGDYEPNNCRYITAKENSNNRRNTKLYTIDNSTKPLSEWCNTQNLNYCTVWRRIRHGWSIRRALELEV